MRVLLPQAGSASGTFGPKDEYFEFIDVLVVETLH
jgi:hypothetical protein